MFVSTNQYYVRYFESLARPKQKAQNIINDLISVINNKIFKNDINLIDELKFKYERFFFYSFSGEILEYVDLNNQADYLYNFLIYCLNNFLSDELGDKTINTIDDDIKDNIYYSDDLTTIVYGQKYNIIKSTPINELCNRNILLGGRLFDESEFDIRLRVDDCKLVYSSLNNNKLLFKYSIFIDKDMKGKVHLIGNL